MDKSLTNNLYKALILIFSVAWMLFITMDYFQKHPGYLMNAEAFQFWGLYSFILIICGSLAFAAHKFRSKSQKYSRGIVFYAFGLILMLITFTSGGNSAHEVANTGTIKIQHLGFLSLKFIQISAYLLLIITACYAAGNLLLKYLKIEFPKNSKNIIDVALGIMIVVLITFIIAAFKVLYLFVLWPILLLIIGLNWKNCLSFVKTLFWQPIKFNKKLNILGIFCFLLLTYLLSINLLQNLSPWPKGWDSLSLYINLPNLIEEYHGLVKGFQPYNWSLFMSLGAVLFKSIETTLALSYVGGVLCLFALYPIAKNIFKLDVNFSLLTCLIFYLIPTINFQSFLEQKVDLGLLFIVLIIINIIMNWAKPSEVELKRSFLDKHLILAGLLTGFAFGIKLTTLFTYFGVIAMIWLFNMGNLAFFCVSIFSLFGILLVKLDDMSGMRSHHLSSDLLQWFLLISGLGLLGWLFVKQREKLVKSLVQTVLYSLFFVLMILPWLGKNFIDADRSLSFNYLLNGKSNAPTFSLEQFEQKWQEKYNKNEQ